MVIRSSATAPYVSKLFIAAHITLQILVASIMTFTAKSVNHSQPVPQDSSSHVTKIFLPPLLLLMKQNVSSLFEYQRTFL